MRCCQPPELDVESRPTFVVSYQRKDAMEDPPRISFSDFQSVFGTYRDQVFISTSVAGLLRRLASFLP